MSSPNSGNTAYTYPDSGDRIIDGLLSGYKWGGPLGDSATISYSFPSFGSTWSTRTDWGYGPPGGFSGFLGEPYWSGYAPLSGSEQLDFVAALSAWAEVADITIVEVSETPSDVGDIRVAYSGAVTYSSAAAWAYYPSPTGGSGSAGAGYGGEAVSGAGGR